VSETKINYSAVILYGVLGAILVLAILYFIPNSPIKPAFNGAWTWATSNLGKINFTGLDIPKLITDNIGAIIGVGGAGLTALITYAKYRSVSATNNELIEQQNLLKLENANVLDTNKDLTTTIGKQAEELGMYSNDKTAEILQTRINEMKDGYERQLLDLNRKLVEKEQELKARPFVEVTTVK